MKTQQTNHSLIVKGIVKEFPGILAVNFKENDKILFSPGEIHGLVGENGAGKSTLASIITGIQSPTFGNMYIGENKYSPENVLDARKLGVEIILQDSGLINKMSVADNLFLGREKRYSSFGIINLKKRNELARDLLSRISYEIPTDLPVSKLDLENKKLVELAKVLYFDPQIIVVDEITAGLSDKSVKLVFSILEELRREKKIVIYISHYLEEIFNLCDIVTVLKDGELISTILTKETDEDHLSTLMVGRSMRKTMYHPEKSRTDIGEKILSVKNLFSKNGYFNNISFDLNEGEILGIGGLLGCGNEELALALFGEQDVGSGEIIFQGKRLDKITPRIAIFNRIAYLPKDRDKEGLILKNSILNNILLPAFPWFSTFGLQLSKAKQKKTVKKLINALRISCRGEKDLPLNLSGGNRQKVAFSKWLVKDNKILLLNNPTRGVDVGAKYEIYGVIRDLASEGIGIVLISQELSEIIGMSDRILIMREGNITKEITKEEYPDEETLITYMIQ